MKRVLSAFMFALAVLVALVLPAPASAAVEQVWHANTGSTINADGTLTLKGGNTSVEASGDIATADEADTLKLTYTLADGAECIGGAPRVYVTVDGTTYNSWDQQIDKGVEAACEARLVLPKAGAVSAMGVVYDNGKPGTVTVTSLTINGDKVDFNATVGEPDPVVVTPVKPGFKKPTCTDTGEITPKETEGVLYVVGPLVDGKITVTAKAKEGYVLKAGAKAEWTFKVAKLTGAQCEPAEPAPGNGGGEQPQTPSASASPTASATGSPTPSSSATVVPGAVGGGDSGSLPKTGVKALTIGGVGGLLVAVGGLLFVWARRRRDQEPGKHSSDGDTQVMPAI